MKCVRCRQEVPEIDVRIVRQMIATRVDGAQMVCCLLCAIARETPPDDVLVAVGATRPPLQ